MKVFWLNLMRGFISGKSLLPLLFFTFSLQTIIADGSGMVQFSASEYTVDENDGSVTITVNRERGGAGAVSVSYEIEPMTAGSLDYSASNGMLSWADGEKGGKSFTIDIINDSENEPIELFTLNLSDPQNGLVLGDLKSSTVKIYGSESGTFRFATPAYITSEYDETVEILVTRGLGAKGAVQVDYEVKGGEDLSDDEIGTVQFARRLPDTIVENADIEYTFKAGVPAKEGRDFIDTPINPLKGTLVFRDYEMSKTFEIQLIPNFDGEAFPFTMAELILSNPRPVEGESENIQPVLHESKFRSTLRINDITGPDTDLIWEQQPWPDTPGSRRRGFSFVKARYKRSETLFGVKTQEEFDHPSYRMIEIPVMRALPYDASVEVGYMIGPNRGMIVDDARENWVNEGPKGANLLTANGDDYDTGVKYLLLPGDEPRITPDSLSGLMDFGDFEQPMHSRFSLPQTILNPGSDVASPFGQRLFTPSFSLPITDEPQMKDFGVVTGKLSWGADDLDPKYIQFKIADDDIAEFNEDIIIVLYNLKTEFDDFARDSEDQIENDGGDGGDGGDGDGDGDGDGGDDEPEEEEKLIKPGSHLGVQYWTTVTIIDDDQPAGGATGDTLETTFIPDINNDVYDLVVQDAKYDTGALLEAQKEEKIYVAGDYTSIDGELINRIQRLNNDGTVDDEFDVGLGANYYVNALDLFVDDDDVVKLLAGGGFTSYDGKPRKGIVRINYDGSVDDGFQPGLGVNGEVIDLKVLDQIGNVVIVGDFDEVDGKSRNSVAKLSGDGKLDLDFDIGLGPDGPVNSVAVMSDGRLIIGGDFIYVGEVYSPSIAVLNSETGQVDSSVSFNQGIDGIVHDIKIDPSGGFYVGGNFTKASGVSRNNIAKFKDTGELDMDFNPGNGFDFPVLSLSVDTSVNVVGDPTYYSRDLEELFKILLDVEISDQNPDLTLPVEYLLEPDDSYGVIPPYFRNIIKWISPPEYRVIAAGAFTEYNYSRRMKLARLNPDGTLDTSFMDTAFNQFAGLPRRFSFRDTQLINVVTQTGAQGDLLIGGSFNEVGGGIDGRSEIAERFNLARIQGGSTPGPGVIGFDDVTFTASERQDAAKVVMRRKNGSLGEGSVYFRTKEKTGSGIATGVGVIEDPEEPIVADYISQNKKLVWDSVASVGFHSDALYYTLGENYAYLNLLEFGTSTNSVLWTHGNAFGGSGWKLSDGVKVEGLTLKMGLGKMDYEVVLLPDADREGNEEFAIAISNPMGKIELNGEVIPAGLGIDLTTSSVVIVDDDFGPGVFAFKSKETYVDEGGRRAKITVERRDGANGTVSVDYSTIDESGQASLDYTSKKGTLVFGSGQTSKSFYINILEDEFQEGDETVGILLSNPRGGAVISEDEGANIAHLKIVDNDLKSGLIEFEVSNYVVEENEGTLGIAVNRRLGSKGNVKVGYRIVEEIEGLASTATTGTDFKAVSGVLTWDNGEVEPKMIPLVLIDDDEIEEDEILYIELFDAEGAILGSNTIATVTIQSADSYGAIEFGLSEYYINENGGALNIVVSRVGGSIGEQSVELTTQDFTASSLGEAPDYVGANVVLDFAEGERIKEYNLVINDDLELESNEKITLTLGNVIGGAELGAKITSVVTIIDDEDVNMDSGAIVPTSGNLIGPDGDIRAIYIDSDGSVLLGGNYQKFNNLPNSYVVRINNGKVDDSFLPHGGANGAVNVIKKYADGIYLIAGEFDQFNGKNHGKLVRLKSNGSVDDTFNIGSSAEGNIHDLAIDSQGRIIAVGDFSSFNGDLYSNVVRINPDGTTDKTFKLDSGVDGAINAVEIDLNGDIVLGGDFTSVRGQEIKGVVKINGKGNVVSGWHLGGFNDSVRDIDLHPSGNILVGGFFTKHNDLEINRVAMLGVQGNLLESFNPSKGPDNPVYAVSFQTDGKILVGGSFYTFAEMIRPGIVRLNSNGTIDPTINFGSGFNGTVQEIHEQNGESIHVGGGFSMYNGNECLNYIEIYGGITEGMGQLEFMDSVYAVPEGGTNAVVRLIRRGGLNESVSTRITTTISLEGTPAVPAIDYVPIDQKVNFSEGEAVKEVNVLLIDDKEVESDETIGLKLSEFSEGAEGDQSVSSIEIVNDDSLITFTNLDFSVSEGIPSGQATVKFSRLGSAIGEASILFQTATNGTAQAALDFVMLTNRVVFADGQTSQSVAVEVIDDDKVELEESVDLLISDVEGSAELGLGRSTLRIIDNDVSPGEFFISPAAIQIAETASFATVSITRTNGYTGLVELSYETTPLTAEEGVDYSPVKGSLVFADSENIKYIDIPIIDNDTVDGAKAFRFRIYEATGGGVITPENFVTIIILDNELGGSLPGPKGQGANGPVYAVAMDNNNNALLAGEFDEINGKAALRVAKVNGSGALLSDFDTGSGPNNTVFATELTQSGLVYLGGLFNKVDGHDRKHVVRLKPEGSVDETFDPGSRIGGTVFDIAVYLDRIVVAGEHGVAVLTLDGGRESGFVPPSIDGEIYAVDVQYNGKILIGGSFEKVNGESVRNFARLNQDGSLCESFDPGSGPNGSVHAITIDDHGILIGGIFVTYDGISSRRIARLGYDGKLKADFDIGLGFDGPVQAIHRRVDGRYLVGGSFGYFNGVIQNNISLVNANGSVVENDLLMLQLNGAVYGISELAGGSSIFGGSFTKDNKDQGYNSFALLHQISSIKPPRLGIMLDDAEKYELSISGAPGEIYHVEFSSNLMEWLGLTKVVIPESGSTKIELGSSVGNKYFRAVYRE